MGSANNDAGIEYLFKEIEDIDVENEVFRPWKSSGATEATFNNFTTVFKEMDKQLLEKVQALQIFSTAFSEKRPTRSSRSSSFGSDFSVWSASRSFQRRSSTGSQTSITTGSRVA
jgi:hypothetical protein